MTSTVTPIRAGVHPAAQPAPLDRSRVAGTLRDALEQAVGGNALALAEQLRDKVSLTNAERGVAFTLAYLGEATARQLVAELDEGDETTITDTLLVMAEHGLARHRTTGAGDVWRLTVIDR